MDLNTFLDTADSDIITLSNKVVEIEDKLTEYKKLEKEQEEFKKQLKEAMQRNGVSKWETTNGTKITLIEDVPDYEAKEIYFDEDKFIEENQELHETYHNKLAEYKCERKVMRKGKKGYLKITLPKESKK